MGNVGFKCTPVFGPFMRVCYPRGISTQKTAIIINNFSFIIIYTYIFHYIYMYIMINLLLVYKFNLSLQV